MDMATRMMPPEREMWEAFLGRDPAAEGVFFTGVRTTGIFCRPTCPARKPARDNVEFFATAADAAAAGYRPCKRCRPLEPEGRAPAWLRPILDAVAEDPGRRWRDADLRAAGVDPARVRRWFKAHHGMTFHAFQRARRVGRALGQLNHGADIVRTAYGNGFDSLSGFNEAVRRVADTAPGETRGRPVIHLSRIPTPLGTMMAGATSEGVCLLEFVERRSLETQLDGLRRRLDGVLAPGETDLTRQLVHELDRYFAGELREFTVPVQLMGSEFQRRAWEALRHIPYGETRSYGEQAAAMGRPDAVRAVARANGDNRIAIVLPCHRVIGKDGSLTGYGGGLWRKRRLLELEGGQAELSLDPAPPA